MGKLRKLPGVSGHEIPKKNNIKLVESNSSIIGNILLFPIVILVFLYKIFIMLPYQPSRFIGLIRLLLWVFLFWFFDHEQLFHRLFIGFSDTVVLSWPLYSILTFSMTAISFMVMLGFNRNVILPEPTTVSGFENMPGMSWTINQVDWNLQNLTQRNKFLKKLF